MGRCARCCGWLSECLIRPDDPPAAHDIKRVGTPVFSVIAGVTLLLLLGDVSYGMSMSTISSALYFLGSLWFLSAAASNVVSAEMAIDSAMFVIAVAIFLNDFDLASGLRVRAWSLMVLLLDACLVVGRFRIPPIAVTVTLVYFVFERVEATVRVGLYEAARFGPREVVELCDCSSPPCSIDPISAFGNLAVIGFVFLLDFYLTRNFASSLRTQLATVRSAVDVAADVADALARYDIDEAESVIANGELPSQLYVSYMQLLQNLSSYKPYLPHSCLVQDEAPARQQRKSLVRFSQSHRTGGHRGSESGWRVEDVSLLRSVAGSNPFANSMETGHYKTNSSCPSRPPMSPTESDDASDLVGSLNSSFRAMGASGIRPMGGSITRRAPPRRKIVTLVCTNRVGYAGDGNDQYLEAAHAEWITKDVDHWCTAVQANKGVVDLVAGDRRYASYNARQPSEGHSVAALRTLFNFCPEDEGKESRFDRLETSSCAVSGHAVCGDFGCTSMMRFMTLGSAPSTLQPLERAAAAWKVRVLVDGDSFERTQFVWEGRLLGAVFSVKRNKTFRLYSMGQPKRGGQRSSQAPEEWMYELAKVDNGKWDEHNEALSKQIAACTRKKSPASAAPPLTSFEEGLMWGLHEVGFSKLTEDIRKPSVKAWEGLVEPAQDQTSPTAAGSECVSGNVDKGVEVVGD
eukprot:Hpha_TRINITY_DN16516_c1_g2::TRINITY_DN16516_c1_g2_i1::g.136667::m.136667